MVIIKESEGLKIVKLKTTGEYNLYLKDLQLGKDRKWHMGWSTLKSFKTQEDAEKEYKKQMKKIIKMRQGKFKFSTDRSWQN